MKCQKCGNQNDADAKYCEQCGNYLLDNSNKSYFRKNWNKKRENENRNTSNDKSLKPVITAMLSLKSIWIFTSVFLFALLLVGIYSSNSNRYNQDNDRFIDERSDNPVIEAKVFEIASNFACGCGSCNEESLDICKCNYAVDERQFIRGYLEQNKNNSDIITAMITKYGGLKPGVSLTKYDESNNQALEATDKSDEVVATLNERVAIYEAFRCPCGQCNVDELKDCTCNHKNGAKEVKKFIDTKIAENRFSVDQIIDVVDEAYGGKK